jgi:hypothetical protein
VDAAGTAVGGITLQPTTIAIDGTTATVTYDVLFAGTAVYSALTGTVGQVGDVWTVNRDVFCSFMSSARTPCA